MLVVEVEAHGLEVVVFGGAGDGAFVPVEAEPLEVGEDSGGGFGGGADLIGVFDAEDEVGVLALALGLSGEEPGVEGGACAADVEETCRRGCEAGTDHGDSFS